MVKIKLLKKKNNKILEEQEMVGLNYQSTQFVENGPIANGTQYYFHISSSNKNILIKLKLEKQYSPLEGKEFGQMQIIPLRKSNAINPWKVKWITIQPELRNLGIGTMMRKIAIREVIKHKGTHFCSDDRRSEDGKRFWIKNKDLISEPITASNDCIDLTQITNIDDFLNQIKEEIC